MLFMSFTKKNGDSFLVSNCSTLFSDTSLLTGELADVVELRTTNLTNLVHGDAVDVRTLDGEDTLYTYGARHLANSEALLFAMTADLDYQATVELYTLLVTFDNSVSHSDGVTSLERRMRLACSKCFFSNFN